MTLPDLLIADTRAHAEYFQAEFLSRDAMVRVLPVGYDENIFSPHADPENRETRVVFFGSYLPLHGTDIIVKAAEILKERPDIQFEMIGDGQTFAAAQHFVQSRTLNNVAMLPRVAMGELPGLLAQADICLGIFGSTDKAGRVVPNKVYQCMGMGKPVITAQSTAIDEMFSEREIVTVPAADATALADAIVKLADDTTGRSELAATGEKSVRTRFSSIPIAQKFVRYCEEAVGR